MQQKQELNSFFKLLLLGDRAVGKTTLLQKFVEELDPDCYYATCGVDQKIRSLFLFNKHLDLKIWDAGGEPSLWHLVRRYLPDANGALVCFDVTNPFSLIKINSYVEKLREAQPNLPIMLIACKSDLTQKRMVSKEQAQQLAQKLGIAYLETSGLKKNNVDAAFLQITQRMYFARMLNNIHPTLEKYFNDYANNPPNPISKKETTLKEEYKLLFEQLLRASSLDELNDFYQKTSNLIDQADALFARKHPIWNTITTSPLTSMLKKTLASLDLLNAEFNFETLKETTLNM
ncbi:GTP-binding protein [Legionella lytica]|uniref:GTP-binding protein n=1 Tax=Legionella lytica TaxID=96232 RepID=A0ABY4Y718_9GAMM|nr:GTP-binding protein [Legionella lytica]USQ13407.1 GTP-binding protein [Legionella lytica]